LLQSRGKILIWNPQHLLSTFSAPSQHLSTFSASFQHLGTFSASLMEIRCGDAALSPLTSIILSGYIHKSNVTLSIADENLYYVKV